MSLLITELPQGSTHEGPVETIELTWDERCKPRRKFTTDRGTEVALSLTRGTILGDGLMVYSDAERTIVVKAKPEEVLVIKPNGVRQLCEVSHHLGNWHRSLQFTDDGFVLTEIDGPLVEWLERTGVAYAKEFRAYEPNLRTAPHE